MKTSTLFQLGATALLAAAQPSAHRRHADFHNKKRNVVTQIENVQVDVDVYYVEDQYGNIISVNTITSTQPGQTIGPVVPMTVPSFPATGSPQAPQPQPQQHSSQAPAPAAPSASTAPAAPAATKPASSSSGGAPITGLDFGGMGMSYDPYTTGPIGANCRPVQSDMAYLIGMFKVIRIYDVGNCNTLGATVAAIKAAGSNSRIIVTLTSTATWESDLSQMISILGGDFSTIHSVLVGNEWSLPGSQISNYIQIAKSTLSGAGYKGPVAYADMTAAFQADPTLCEASDYVAANIHAYFDQNTVASNAGQTVQSQVNTLEGTCGGKKVLVTESGWPSEGATIGQAVASSSNQAAALSSLKSAFPDNLVFFEAYNALYKTGALCEQYFGIFPANAGLF